MERFPTNYIIVSPSVAHSYFVDAANPGLKLSANKDTVVAGESFTLSATATPQGQYSGIGIETAGVDWIDGTVPASFSSTSATGIAELTFETKLRPGSGLNGEIVFTAKPGSNFQLDESFKYATVNVRNLSLSVASTHATLMAAEGDTVMVKLVASTDPGEPVSVKYTPTNTTGMFLDVSSDPKYLASGTVRTESLTFALDSDGNYSAMLPVKLRDDNSQTESQGTVTVALNGFQDNANYAVGAAAGSSTITVNDGGSTSTPTGNPPTTISEADGAAKMFNFMLSAPVSQNAELTATRSSNSTAETSDYSMSTAINGTTAALTITMDDDSIYEGDETLILDLAATNATFSAGGNTQTLTITITDDEEKPRLAIADSNLTVKEGEAASISVKASVLSEAAYTVAFTATDVAGDFLDADSGDSSLKTFTFESQNGEWIDELSIATRNANGTNEDHGEISVALATPEDTDGYTIDGTANTATITVQDADTPKLSISGAADVTAGAVAMFQVTADLQPFQSLAVRFTATNDTGDFLDSNNLENPQTLTFSSSSGVISSMLEIATQYDPNSSSGTIRVDLVENESSPKPYELAEETANRSATVNVANPTVPSLIVRDSKAREGPTSSTTVMEFTVVLSPPSAMQVDVTWTTSTETGDTALAGTDFEMGTELLTFNPGDKTKIFQVTIIGDGVEDGNKTFSVTLSNPTGGAVLLDPVATGTILDYVAVPVLSIIDTAQPVSEGSAATIRVKSSIRPETTLTVGYTVTDMGGNLFDSVTSDPNPKRMSFKLVGSEFIGELKIGTKSNSATEEEPGEISVSLKSPESADRYAIDDEAKTALISVVDESVHIISISAGSSSVTEGQDIEIALQSNPIPTKDFDVKLRVTQTGDNLVWPVKNSVRFNSSSGTVSLILNTIGNPDATDSEVVTVEVVEGEGYISGNPVRVNVMKKDPDGTAKYSVVSSVITAILSEIPPTPPGESSAVKPMLSIRSVRDTVAEGEAAVFAVFASYAVKSGIPVKIRLSESGDFIVGPLKRTVNLQTNLSETEFAVATENDELAEADGRITATIQTDSGYFVGSQNTAHVTVSDALDRQHRKSRVKTALHAVLPDLLAHSTAQTFAIANIRTAQGFSGSPSTSIELNGESPAMTALQSGGEMLNDGSTDWKSLIDDSSFTVALYPEGGETSPATVWGVGDKWSLASDGNGSSQSWDGETYSGHFGFDARIGRGMLAGLAMSLSQSEISYGQTSESGMSFDSMTTAVHPYFGIVSGDGNFGMRVLAGYGENELELKQEEYSPETLNGHFHTVGFSGSNLVYSNGNFGGLHNVELSIAGEAWQSRQFVDSVAGVFDNLQLEVRHVRIAIEENHDHNLGIGGIISPSITVGLQGDGRNEKSNFRLNVGSTFKYDAFSGLEVLSSGKSLLSGLNRMHRWEIESSLDYDSGNDDKGILFKISRSWNGTDENVKPYIWRSGLADDSNNSFGSPDGGSMEIEVGYGFEVLDGAALITPYSAFNRTNSHGSEFQIGSRFATDTGIDFELEASRSVPEFGTAGNEFNLTGNIDW